MAATPSPFSSKFVLVVLACICPWAVFGTRSPAVVSKVAPSEDFSAERALADLEWIAEAPRPTGSEANDLVREHLLERLVNLGFECQEQIRTLDATMFRGRAQSTATQLINVLARKRGTGGGGALVLLAHYDSVPAGPGAGDDGAGVAAMLEAARALAGDPPGRNDLILLLTDGEELGLLGARLFLDEHPWADEILAVFNFEGRGAGGPAVLFQVGPDSGALVEAYARNAPHPFGTSLAPAIFERMPNDTDFTPFLRRGVPGLNFAFLGGGRTYHQKLDTIDELDAGSLQQHGEAMTALVRALSDHDFGAASTSDREFFMFDGRLVTYPQSWTIYLAVGLAVAAMWIVRRRSRSLGLRMGTGLGSAFLVVFAVLLAAASAIGVGFLMHTMCAVLLKDRLARGSNLLSGEVLSVALWFTVLGGALLLLSARPFQSRVHGIASGAVVIWALLAVALGLAVPGAGHIGVLGLLSALGSYVCLAAPEKEGPRAGLPLALLLWLPGATVLALLTPLFVQVGSVLPIAEVVLGCFGAGLLVSTALPLVAALARHERRGGYGLCFLGGVLFAVHGTLYALGH